MARHLFRVHAKLFLSTEMNITVYSLCILQAWSFSRLITAHSPVFDSNCIVIHVKQRFDKLNKICQLWLYCFQICVQCKANCEAIKPKEEMDNESTMTLC